MDFQGNIISLSELLLRNNHLGTDIFKCLEKEIKIIVLRELNTLSKHTEKYYYAPTKILGRKVEITKVNHTKIFN